jgi:biotin-(acetyl-CoA carboxylase) ligase
MRTALDAALGRWVEADPADVRGEFERRDALRGRRISWEGGPDELGRTGVAGGLDERGTLLVRGDDGELASLGSGEVSLKLS